MSCTGSVATEKQCVKSKTAIFTVLEITGETLKVISGKQLKG
jgi:hypothetical protein